MTSIGTARHFQPPGTTSDVCRDHNRAVLAPTVALEALRRGLGPDLTDAQLDECATAAGRAPLSDTSRAAVRAALRPALSPEDSPEAVHEQLFSLSPGHPLPIKKNGQRYLLVPIPLTL